MREQLGVGAVITSAYITWRTPPLRARAEEVGIHTLLGFDGPVMTDSGAFQQHAYGSVEVGAEEIVDFQQRVGSDIATVLDLFTEPDASVQDAAAALSTTLERARAARSLRTGLLAVPVQGGSHEELRARSALTASEFGDVLAVGGVVPLMEQYRFPELARVLSAARPTLSPGAAVHLFGTGHPMVFAFAALFGVDLFDSSAYHKFARRGMLLFPEGTRSIADLREPICRCSLCGAMPLPQVAALPPAERERRIAFHNLLTSIEEIGRVRQAIRDGSLWELAERRAAAHPALRAGLAEARGRPEVFLPCEPESRRAFREVEPGSRDRPAVVRFLRRVRAYQAGRPRPRHVGHVPLRPEYLCHIPTADRAGAEVNWETETPFGPVPLELTDLYPVGPYLGVDEFAHPTRHRPPSTIADEVGRSLDADWDRAEDWTEPWTRRQVLGLLTFQYGRDVGAGLANDLKGNRSPRTGRLRAMVSGGQAMFHVGTDGVPRPTFRGAERLHSLLSPGRQRVVVAEDAAEFVRQGRSLFTRFVVDIDPALVPDASLLLVDRSDGLLAVGRLLLAPHEIPRLARGVAARVTAHAPMPEPPQDDEELASFPPV
jgi:7-cyano-7-deazaguanine tRNA-ribosyltransferase